MLPHFLPKCHLKKMKNISKFYTMSKCELEMKNVYLFSLNMSTCPLTVIPSPLKERKLKGATLRSLIHEK